MQRCLAVEDNHDSLALLEEILEEAGYLVELADNGIQALELVQQSPPDIIISDILLPIMDGFEFCYRIKSNAELKNIPFIFYTASYTDSDSFRLAESLQADKFIIKPIEPEILLSIIDKLLNQSVNKPSVTNPGMDATEFYERHKQCVNLKLVELHQEQAVRQATELRFHRLVKNLPDECFFYRINSQGEFTFVSPSIKNILGYEESEFLGAYDQYFSKDQANDAALCCMKSTLAGKKQQCNCEASIIDKQGELHFIKFIQIPLLDEDDFSEIEGIAFDLTSLRNIQQQLYFQANYDALTQLPNRVLAQDRLRRCLANAERYDQSVGIIYLDLDNFKDINDVEGHETGDQVLQLVARRVEKCIREVDTVARLSGDEFLFILPFETVDTALDVVANKIIKTIAQPMLLNNKEHFVTASLGITLFPLDGKDPDKLMRNADLAMYQSKSFGRNTFHYFTDELNQQAQHRVEMENCLRHALNNNELKICYQPLKALQSGRVIGVEALLRWNSSVLGQVAPAEFIPLAESTGSIMPISAWVLEQACLALGKLSKQYPYLQYIAINISPCQFRQDDFTENLLKVLEQYHLPVSSLVLEITENTLMENIPRIKNHFQALQQASFSMAIDDFGTGYSSLSYLKQFPFKKLKIDRSFIRDIGHDPEDEALVRAIILMAHSLGIEVIAEGVENDQQHAFLMAYGCEIGQGYFYGEPKPLN